jgi:glutamyl endopeptidase
MRELETVRNLVNVPEMHAAGEIVKTAGYQGGEAGGYGITAQRLLVRGNGELESKGSPNLSISPTGRLNPETVIGTDDRIRVVDSETLPWRMICSLEISGPTGSGIGTGWFAGPKTLITAGHCVFHSSLGGWANQIIIYPGRFGSNYPYPKSQDYTKPIVSNRFSALKGWTEDQNTNFDYAAIHIDDPVGNETGWFSMAALDDDTLKGLLVNIAGYPGDRDYGRNQYFASDKIEKVDSSRIYYAADTYGGQSGGPAWIQDDNNQPVSIGVHSYGVSGTNKLNSATRITVGTLNTLKSWIEADAQ